MSEETIVHLVNDLPNHRFEKSFLTTWARNNFFGDANTHQSSPVEMGMLQSAKKLDKQSLDYEVLQCVDRALSSYGSSIRQTVYWQLLMKFNIKASEIPANPELFSSRLERILGSGGAVMVERAIVNEMIARFDIKELDRKKFSLALDRVKRTEIGSIPN